MRAIVMAAAPYCYGPTAKLLCIAEELSRRYPLIYISSEPGLSLARNGPFERCIASEDREQWNEEALAVMRESAAVVSFLDYRALRPAMEFGRTAIFFDTLQWTRKKVPPFTSAASAYVAQRFFAPSSIDPLPDRWHWVGAVLPNSVETILDEPPQPWSLSSVVVSLGGLRSPAMIPGADSEYVEFIVRLLRPMVGEGLSITLCAPIYIQSKIQALIPALTGVEVCFPSASEFHDILAKADLLLTVPGLEVVLEAMALSVPILFLPPYNGSQALQLEIYEDHEIALYKLLSARFCEIQLRDADPKELTKLVQDCNRHAIRDEVLVGRLMQEVCGVLRAISGGFSWVENKRNVNRQRLKALGVGGRTCATEIIDTLVREGRRG